MSYREELRTIRKERKTLKKLSPEWRSTITKEKALKLAKSSKVKSQKPKKKTRSKLVKELDAIFSKYIRLKYADNLGRVSCFTCGKVYRRNEKGIQNGHFITRGCYKLRREEMNCRPQCYRCNVKLKGNYIEYTRNLIAEIGIDAVDWLRGQKLLQSDISTQDIINMIEKYSMKVGEFDYYKNRN